MIYFDAAATAFQKPRAVKMAVARAMDTMSSPGRGNYSSAALAAHVLYQCREEAAALFGVNDPEQVIFTVNTTHALNIAIRSLVKAGSQVVISGYEHNAVTRMLYSIEDITVRVVDTPLFDHASMLHAFAQEVTEETDAVICTHVSNVFGYILPIGEIAALCRERGVPLIIDAAQSAGSVPLDQGKLQAAFIAMPGHKGLYGPQGTGILLCSGEARPLIYGGTGSSSRDQNMPDFLPDRLEAGTHNMPGIAGLLEGIRFVRRTGIPAIRKHGWMLKEYFADALSENGRYHVFFNHDMALQGSVLSFLHQDMDCEELCQRLGEQGFALRGGYHCAPFAHKTVGTLEKGTVRFSVSAFNRKWEAEQLLRELKKL